MGCRAQEQEEEGEERGRQTKREKEMKRGRRSNKSEIKIRGKFAFLIADGFTTPVKFKC